MTVQETLLGADRTLSVSAETSGLIIGEVAASADISYLVCLPCAGPKSSTIQSSLVAEYYSDTQHKIGRNPPMISHEIAPHGALRHIVTIKIPNMHCILGQGNSESVT